MEQARYRAGDEVDAAATTLEAPYKLHKVATFTQVDDPLRDAAQVAITALHNALYVSPILKIARPRTVLESQLPHGANALDVATHQGPDIRARLDALRAVAMDEPPGSAPTRRALVAAVINAARDVLDELKSGDHDANHLAVLTSAREIDDAVLGLPYFWTSAMHVNHVLFARTRRMLPFPFHDVMRAMLAAAQHADRGGGAGAPPRGALNHLTELAELLRIAGLECSKKALQNDCRDAYAERHARRRVEDGGKRSRLEARDDQEDREGPRLEPGARRSKRRQARPTTRGLRGPLDNTLHWPDFSPFVRRAGPRRRDGILTSSRTAGSR